MKPNQTLALLQHQINWWSTSGGVFKGGNFNVDHFEKVLEARVKRNIDVICIFHSPFYKPKINVLNNNRFIKHHYSK